MATRNYLEFIAVTALIVFMMTAAMKLLGL